MKKLNKKKKNMGFSMVELIVALLISTIVIATIGFFVMTGVSSYQKASAEVTLQMEAQTANNQIIDLLLEAKTYRYFPDINIDGGIYQTLVVVIDSIDLSDKEYYYIVIANENIRKLLLYKAEKTEEMVGGLESEAAKIIKDVMLVSPNKYLLANHVKSITVSPLEPLDEQTLNQLVHITIDLELSGKDFTTTNSITVRNGLQ